MGTPAEFHSVQVVRDHLDENRRRVPCEPFAVMYVKVGKTLRRADLSEPALARLLAQAAAANLIITEKKDRP